MIITSVPHITSVLLKGLNNVTLPFTSHVLDPGLHGADDDALSPLTRAGNNDKYIVKSITGLEPPDRNVAIAAGPSGGKFQGVTVEDREVVVLIVLNPNWEAGETPKLLRDNLYTMIYAGYNPKIDIRLMAGTTAKYHEYAYVSKFEASIFDKDPMVQITFTCLNPTFRAMDVTKYPSGDLSETHPNIYNHDTAETGFKFGVKFTDDLNNWFIKQAENQSIGMRFEHAFEDGDLLTVNTIPGERYVHLKKHRGKVMNKLDIMTADSEWVQLHPGHNHFVVRKKSGKWDWKGPLTFTARSAGI